MKRAALWAFMCCAALALPAHGRVPLPAALAASASWQLQGAGEMSFLGWRIYEAALWRLPAGGEREVLAIRYNTDISCKQLVESTLDEMRRIGIDQPERWTVQLQKAFPDVDEGDTLFAERHAGGVRFFNRTGLIHAVDDPAFAPAFFGIWLHPKTREPQLRAALLGEARQ
ncbi:chalcone isomerase family protein [Nitrogeniibacter aestuarii]|uniref:chalcone isomerase family protein n=1 Tax=Nitrogeniibacter aestuarii TaxID=2815343 RepID=UPI001E3A82A6|nr:chalcone isomerase family protein [Nitrogeniibacter aestuarii]